MVGKEVPEITTKKNSNNLDSSFLYGFKILFVVSSGLVVFFCLAFMDCF